MAHAWMPTSPCGPSCLTGDEPTVGPLHAALRLCGAVAVLVAAALSAPLLPLIGRRGREFVAKAIFRTLLRAVGVRLVVTGADELRAGRSRGALVVANHISWLDIAAVNAVRPMRALAKQDIRAWPVLGPVVAAAGTLFVDRERLRTLPDTVASVATAVRGGSLVYVCPEGTTWCGQGGMGRFRPALFQAAIDGGVPVRPIALRYRVANGPETPAPAFIGTETIIESVRRTARLKGLVLEVRVLDELAPGRADNRAQLAELAEAAVNSALGRVTIPTQTRRVSPLVPRRRKPKTAA
ncbi:lysophospholipid acyltransferase family protein [Actinokineospora auranticolor]|uniref:1-acyl-sn-glycerol-3-phosphate acyltransferase n=1 Tax=Actinokineospora auranticolor TaxID=155976 RepID=A0A2S6GCE8_9PSEU|nr:lysophospholipid acyltransferase family protein [Actinokineospora auranticolor]PPK62393.1 1-acyl-sn-glycerol-3-phosphate acyltransferase [Actinokineospora auranticolor]